MTGDELAQTAQVLRPGLKVVLTSGFAMASVQAGRQSKHFRAFLGKPYRKAELAQKLREILDAQR